MRRKDREITERADIERVFRDCKTLRLGMRDGEETYVVPMSFGWCCEDGTDRFYLHCASEGKKLDLLRVDPRVGFEMDIGYEVHAGDIACEYSAAFRSIIGRGTVTFVEDRAEKRHGLDTVMMHQTGKHGWDYAPQMLDRVCVLRVDVRELACKEHL